jgi:hypothetical protein
MDDASGVKTVQCDQGEARRSGVIPRLLRRLFICVRRLDINQSQKIYNAVTCVRFFPVLLGRDCNRKNCSTFESLVFDTRL